MTADQRVLPVAAVLRHRVGGAVAEMLAANCPVPLERVGVSDTFGESGDGDELLDKYGLSCEHIIDAARRAIARKS